jgi:hypothetical protein
MIHTPDINFRYRGPRESVKLVTQVGGGIADLRTIQNTLNTHHTTYDTDIPDCFTAFSSTYTPVIQKARVISEFIRRKTYVN